MNKKKVDELISKTYSKLVCFSNDGKMEKAYRSHVASFGAAMATGSMLAAVSNFVADDVNSKAKQKEGKQLGGIMWELYKENYSSDNNQELLDQSGSLLLYLLEVQKTEDRKKINRVKNELMEIAVAMKLAMNFFELVDEKSGEEK